MLPQTVARGPSWLTQAVLATVLVLVPDSRYARSNLRERTAVRSWTRRCAVRVTRSCRLPTRPCSAAPRAIGFLAGVEERLLQGTARHVRALHHRSRHDAPVADWRIDVRPRGGTAAEPGAPAAARPAVSVRDRLSASEPAPALPVRIRRGFAVPPGNYTVFIVLRDRPGGPPGAENEPERPAANGRRYSRATSTFPTSGPGRSRPARSCSQSGSSR